MWDKQKSQESGQRTSGDFTAGADIEQVKTQFRGCSLGERATRKIV